MTAPPVAGSVRLAGLSLEQHAGITVALAEGFARAEVLAQEGVTEVAFRRADIAWKKRLAADARQGGALFAAHQEKRALAEDWLRRDVAPLDTDIGAWLGLCNAFGPGSESLELLRRWSLTLADIARIGRAWERQLARDAKLRARAAELRASAKPPSRVSVSPARLRPFPWSTPAPRPAPAGQGAPVVSRAPERDAEPLVIVPVVPSYLRADARPAAPVSPAIGVPPALSAPLPSPPAPLPSPPAPPPSPPAPPRRVDVTLDGFVLPRRRTLPFARPPLPVSAEGPPNAASPLPGAAASLPTAEQPTAAPDTAGKAAGTEPRGPLGTVVVFDVNQLLGARGAPPPPAPSPPLTLEEHAAMRLELTLRPGRLAEVLRLAGLDPASLARLDQHYGALRRSSPQINAAWEQAYRAAWSSWMAAPWPGPRR